MKTIGLIGYGRQGTRLFEKFNKYGNVKFVCERKINDKLLEIKREYKVDVSDDYKETLDKVELVVIATPTESHYEIAKECLLNGKDIFLEKPPCTTPEQFKEILDIAKEKNLKVYVDDVFLHREEYKKLKEILAKEKISRINFIWKKYGTFDDSILNALAYHDMYLLIDLLGKAYLEIPEIIHVEDPLERKRFDILGFTCKYNGTPIEFFYDRTSDKKEKIIRIIAGSMIIEWNNEEVKVDNALSDLNGSNDSVSVMVSSLINKKVDYEKNNSLALKSLEFINGIENALALQNTR